MGLGCLYKYGVRAIYLSISLLFLSLELWSDDVISGTVTIGKIKIFQGFFEDKDGYNCL